MWMRTRALMRVELATLFAMLVFGGIVFCFSVLPKVRNNIMQGRRAVCLYNLSAIGKALWQYASEDSADAALPIHASMLAPPRIEWEWRTISAHGWGGSSAVRRFKASERSEYWLSASSPPSGAISFRDYDESTRPLTFFITGGRLAVSDRKKLEWFRCPYDRGYPDSRHIESAPQANAGRSCFETLGNSYRANLLPLATREGDAAKPMERQFSLGPWGTRISTLTKTNELVWVAEPPFFSMLSETETDPNVLQRVQRQGWHGRPWQDNVLFVDGSVRTTRIRDLGVTESPATQPAVMSERWLVRGDGFRLDTYPVGGARIFGDWSDYIEKAAGRWPFANMQDNFGRP